jgi:hypothetical protein
MMSDASQLYEHESLLVLYTPHLEHIYPTYLDVDQMLARKEAYFFLVGRYFSPLT